MVDQRGWANDAGVHALIDASHRKATGLEVVLAISVKVVSNSVNHLAGTPLDTAVQGCEWGDVREKAACMAPC